VIFGLTHNHNLHCGLGFCIDNHNIFSFIKKTFCMVTLWHMYEYCTRGNTTVLGSYHHYIALWYSWVQTQFVGMGIYMPFYHVVLSSLLSYKEHMYCICYFIKLYNYLSVSLNLIQSNMLKENYRSQIISLNKLLEQESIFYLFSELRS
jgi:hypothetical protein